MAENKTPRGTTRGSVEPAKKRARSPRKKPVAEATTTAEDVIEAAAPAQDTPEEKAKPVRRRKAAASAADAAPVPKPRARRPRKASTPEPVLEPIDEEADAGTESGLDPGALAGVAAELEAAAAGAGLWDDGGADGDVDDPLDFVLDADPVDPTDPIQIAAGRIGIERLHPEQRRVIDAVLAGRDVLMVLPTGFGKSACYQIPSMVLPKPTVVISPLLALMRDQYEKLLKQDVPVVRLDGTVRGKHRKAAVERIAKGGSLLVMTTPETLATEDALNALGASGVSLAAIDEAHCISEWGYDFRPTYLQLGERLRRLGAPPVLALTATATEKVRTAIQRFVGMRDPEIIASSPHRSNLAFDVLRCSGDQRLRALMRLVLRLRRPGIIYCSTTREVDEIYALLHRFGAPAHRYHGKMNAGDRTKQQDAFMRRGRRTVMVATNAFGLGIDKQDIRYVLHYQSPASLETYVQEAGRAGRDGRRSNCILLFSNEDRLVHEALLSRSRVRPEQLYKLARALAGWAGEGKVPGLEALALSADLGPKVAGALLAVMEEATLVKWDSTAVYVTIPAEEIEAEARKLAGQFATLRTQDSRRLDSVAAYAEDKGCRAVFLREYFGEEGAEPCGLCDTCRGSSERPSMFYEPLEAPRNAPRRPLRRGPGARRPEQDRRRDGERGRRGGRQRGRGRGDGPRTGTPRPITPGAPRTGGFGGPRTGGNGDLGRGMAPRDAQRFGGGLPFERRPPEGLGLDDGTGQRRRGRRGRRRGRRREGGPNAGTEAAPPEGALLQPPRFEGGRPQRPVGERNGPAPRFGAPAVPGDPEALGPDGLPHHRRRRRRRGRRGRGSPEGGDTPHGNDPAGPTS